MSCRTGGRRLVACACLPLGPVGVQGDGVELEASLDKSATRSKRERERVAQLPYWELNRVYHSFQTRMDSLLRRRAIVSARTNDAGFYEMSFARRDSIELFAFTEFDVGGSLVVWRDRIVGDGRHDLPTPARHMTHVYCGEP